MSKILKHILPPGEKRRIFNIKITRKDKRQIKENAKRYAGGNMSEWVRYASIHYKPAENELVSQAS